MNAMKVSKRASYGLRALVSLARHPEGASAHAIATEERLPEDYLEKILQHLKRTGFVVSQKGVRGGYSLAQSPENIASWDILETLDGGLQTVEAPIFSGTLSPCPILSHCKTKNVWQQLESALKNTLSRVTLADLVPQETRSKRPLKKISVCLRSQT